MPYEMFKQDGKFCVRNKVTGKSKGCSADRPTAVAHMRALYAAEGGATMGKKELEDLVLKEIHAFNETNQDDPITVSDAYHAIVDEFEFPDEEEYEAEDEASEQEEKARSDVSPADKKRAVAEYGNVTYADPANKKYPVDTEAHIRAAWSYIGMSKNQKKYSPAQVASIKRRIISAWKSKIDKAGPPKASTKELLDNFLYALKSVFGVDEEETDNYDEVFGDEEKECENCDEDKTDLMVWKEADTGQYRWFGRYSNNFRDVDNPPEIISEASHKAFVDKVEKGLASMPELWLWHIKDWKIGQADWLAYDDSGFALASGTFTKGLEDVAEWLMEQNDVLMSHGMPPSTIVYDKSDPSVIVEHETKEISVLPRFAAANKLTGFAVLGKEEVMAIPKEKREFLLSKWKADPALLDRLEAMNAETATAAKEAGLESKETETKEEETAKVEAETAKTEEVTTETTPVEAPVSRSEIAEALAAVLTPMVDRIDTLERSIDGVLNEVKELKTAQADQVKQVLESTPAASLGALIAQRVIGDKNAAVDGRSELAKSKPKEASQPDEHTTGIPFLDSMLSEKRP